MQHNTSLNTLKQIFIYALIGLGLVLLLTVGAKAFATATDRSYVDGKRQRPNVSAPAILPPANWQGGLSLSYAATLPAPVVAAATIDQAVSQPSSLDSGSRSGEQESIELAKNKGALLLEKRAEKPERPELPLVRAEH